MQQKRERSTTKRATREPRSSKGQTSGPGRSDTGITEEEVRARAYDLYVERGGEPGRELDDWLRAERELRPTEARV